jgi:hypothetical protein
VVRAVGRIVVCVEADAEVKMVAERASRPMWPMKLSPNKAGPIAAKTSAELSGLPRPASVSPTPANATVATVTIA